ncbi:putative ATPase [Mycolicibacterium chubuense NBB4]|uniref:Putative ATPase n=1 Tax=Mycolicibacterium chubuense (strain NBB4) TaxID=710421 RepID=I4BIL7_MYCCN|nr:adenylate/guanylate cyclase domain-containing protein [Mycolicibacterium chubuense]AFM17124.1 putative ATPase [Mycolicibacterium chubuense NBB4]
MSAFDREEQVDASRGSLPAGTVTLLLADIESSTRLWDAQPARMAEALARLDHLLDGLVAAFNGVRPVEQGEGDSFVLAFRRAGDAVSCAVALQRAALSPIRLRIGVHTGDVDLRDERNYMGPTINRAARVRELAHGGQTVLSSATRHLVLESLPAQAWLKDLGCYRLRDLPRPERVVQLCHPDLHNDFPPLRGGRAEAFHRRPAQLTEFVGRAGDVASVGRALTGNRLVTLCGTGGVGKTRLAVEVADRAGERFPDGTWYVDLAPVADPKRVPLLAAQALALPDGPDRTAVSRLLQHLGDRHLLLLLDNCEHVLSATTALVSAVLSSCPRVTVLATSREPLHISGGRVVRVPPMAAGGDATALFTARARDARPEFAPGPGELARIAEICGRLDGLPLAIELAASRVRTLSLAEIAETLHDPPAVLSCECRSTPARHRSLRACLDWSYELLTESEKALLGRLATFPGGFDREAARGLVPGHRLSGRQIGGLVDALVDKSLLTCDSSGSRALYRLNHTTRQYLLEASAHSRGRARRRLLPRAAVAATIPAGAIRNR